MPDHYKEKRARMLEEVEAFRNAPLEQQIALMKLDSMMSAKRQRYHKRMAGDTHEMRRLAEIERGPRKKKGGLISGIVNMFIKGQQRYADETRKQRIKRDAIKNYGRIRRKRG